MSTPLATPSIAAPNISSLYDVSEQIGSGAFAAVYKARKLSTNELRAAKVYDKASLASNKKWAETVVREKAILRVASHNNIIRLHECIETQDKIYLMLDLFPTNLQQYLVARRILPEASVVSIIRQLLEAVVYLHRNSIVHRDIKLENILISDSDHIQLADFGCAKMVQEWDVHCTPYGTAMYLAPEIVRNIESQGSQPLCTTRPLVKKVDVWSCGVVMFMLIAGVPPFLNACGKSGLISSGQRRALLGEIQSKASGRKALFVPQATWEKVSPEAQDLIVKMLVSDSRDRISCEDALLHPLFSKSQTPVGQSVRGDDQQSLADEGRLQSELIFSSADELQADLLMNEDVEGDITSYNVDVVSPPEKKAPRHQMRDPRLCHDAKHLATGS